MIKSDVSYDNIRTKRFPRLMKGTDNDHIYYITDIAGGYFVGMRIVADKTSNAAAGAYSDRWVHLEDFHGTVTLENI